MKVRVIVIRDLARRSRAAPRMMMIGVRTLGHGLGALGDSVLGELAREQQADGRLDLPGRERRLLVVPREADGLDRETVKGVVHEGVHDRHGPAGDARVRVHLLEHFVDVRRERFHALLAALGAAGLLRALRIVEAV